MNSTNQKDVYTTAKAMGIKQEYACGWYKDPEGGFGWQVVRMRDFAVLCHINTTIENLKVTLFDMGINKTNIAFI